MAERPTVYVDDVTGRQLARPEDATNGGAKILRDDDARRWLKDNPDLAMKEEAKAEPKSEEKEVEKPAENKARSAGANKGQKG